MARNLDSRIRGNDRKGLFVSFVIHSNIRINDAETYCASTRANGTNLCFRDWYIRTNSLLVLSNEKRYECRDDEQNGNNNT